MRIIKNAIILLVAIPVILGVARVAYEFNRGPQPQVQAADAVPQLPELEILDYRGYQRESGYYSVEGQVRNATAEPISSVFAVVTWYGSGGQFITTDDALIEYRPLMPGQTSPFQVLTNGNPLMKRFAVEFKTGNGRQLRHTDSKK